MSVRFTYNEQQIEDNKITDLGILDNEIASLQIWCHNDTKKTLQNLRIVTNLPEGSYQFDPPKTIEPGRNVSMRLTLDTSVLWDDKTDDVAFKLQYDLVKTVGL